MLSSDLWKESEIAQKSIVVMRLTHCRRRRRNNNGRLRRDCDPVRRVYDGTCRDMTSGTAVNSMNPSPLPPMGPGTHGERRRLEQNGKGENTAAAARAVSISDTISAQCDQIFGPPKARDRGQKAPRLAREKKH